MDASIATAIIGLLGAAAVGGLGFILTGLRSDTRDNRAGIKENGEQIKANGERIGRLEVAFARLEERSISEFGQIKDVLARIEATQAEHGRQIEKLGGDLP